MPTADNQHTTLPAVATPGAMASFQFDGRYVRIYSRHGEPVFDARDVSRELGHKEASGLTRRLDADEKGLHSVQTLGGIQEVSIVTEAGLYRAIASRRQVTTLGVAMSDRVARFQRWVFHEVLPSIRKTGSYGMPAAPAATDMLSLLKDPAALLEVLGHYAKENLALTAIVAEKTESLAVAAPKIDAYDALLNADGMLTLSNAGRAVGAPHDAFMAWLRGSYLFHQDGVLVPKAPFMGMGVFVIRTHMIGGLIRPQTYVTPKGLVVLRRRWNKGPGALARYVAAQQQPLPGIA